MWHCNNTPLHRQLSGCSNKGSATQLVARQTWTKCALQSLPVDWQFGFKTLSTDPHELLLGLQIKAKPLGVVSNLCALVSSIGVTVAECGAYCGFVYNWESRLIPSAEGS